MTEANVRAWYRIVCDLPSAGACDAELEVWPTPKVCEDGLIFGNQDGSANTIAVAICKDVHETITTILHEVAHFAQNQRHRRLHGYSWRRSLRELTIELVAIDPLPLANEYRRRYPRFSKAVALDRAVASVLFCHREVSVPPAVRTVTSAEISPLRRVA